MYGFFSRRLVLAQVLPITYRSSVVQHLAITPLFDFVQSFDFIPNARLFPVRTKLFSTGEDGVKMKPPEQYSFTASYLVNSCGLSPDIAKSVAKKVKLQSPEKPDSVLKILKNRGFTNAQIAKLVRMRPSLLLADPERYLLPKFEFLNSFGVTNAEIANVCSSGPSILCQSLEKSLIPNYNFLKSVLLSDENVVKAFRKKSRIFGFDLQKQVAPKLAVLRELGMPKSFIALILTCYAPVVLQRSEKFNENIKKVIGLGFGPEKCGFIHAMHVFASTIEPTREHKLDVLRRWGWSDEDIRLAFRRCPGYINASENKIISAFDFLVNKMGWQSTDVASYPDVFLMNLEKRVIPRCFVIKILQSKGLVRTSMSLGQFLRPVETKFFDRFVTKYVHDIPQLVKIYQRKESLDALDLNYVVSSSISTLQK